MNNTQGRVFLAVLILLICAFAFIIRNLPDKQPPANLPAPEQAGGPRPVLFCHWNVENLFDDRDDKRKGPGDREYDAWLANNPEILQQKLGKLCDALLQLNDGKGPDILAVVEVEGLRAAQLLQQALNQRLSDPLLHYPHVLVADAEVSVGRHIGPAIITRLPVVGDRTRGFGKTLRILQGVVRVNNHELIVLASHWTSRLNGGDRQRMEYADKVYGYYRSIVTANPQADVLICGDFNDSPDDVSVNQGLHASADRDLVRAGTTQPPMLFNLMAGKSPREFGTHYDNGRWYQFDQILVSPGMLDDSGWTCDVTSLKTINTLTKPGDRIGRPWRFGGEKTKGARGYSDHFPVTVRLHVAG